jgi:hypothetical protein
MKPTPRQNKILEMISNQVHFWMNTNDIDSPTHYSDLEDDVQSLEYIDQLSKEDAKQLENMLGDIYDFIKKRK